jgi:hypothetical protein
VRDQQVKTVVELALALGEQNLRVEDGRAEGEHPQ